jgi:hypothetical protein
MILCMMRNDARRVPMKDGMDAQNGKIKEQQREIRELHVVLKEIELEVILHNLATVKRGGGWDYPDPGQLYYSVTDTRTSQVRVHHKCACVISEFTRLFAKPTCLVVRYYPDTDQSA